MAYALREFKWVNQVLETFGIKHKELMHQFCDNKSAIYIAVNPVFHERTKHMKRDCHQIHDTVHAKLITTDHITTKEKPTYIYIYIYKIVGVSPVCPRGNSFPIETTRVFNTP